MSDDYPPQVAHDTWRDMDELDDEVPTFVGPIEEEEGDPPHAETQPIIDALERYGDDDNVPPED